MSPGSSDDRLTIENRELYWLPAGGILDSQLDLDRVTRLAGGLTMRTMGTIGRIAAKLPEAREWICRSAE